MKCTQILEKGCSIGPGGGGGVRDLIRADLCFASWFLRWLHFGANGDLLLLFPWLRFTVCFIVQGAVPTSCTMHVSMPGGVPGSAGPSDTFLCCHD